MKRDYTILRKVGRLSGSYTSETASADYLSVERSAMSFRNRRDASSSRDILAIAPSMGVLSLHPVRKSVNAPAVSWGLKQVRATDPNAGAGLNVGILDSGIDLTHPVFNHSRPLYKDFTNEGLRDDSGHGTHCASILFGNETVAGHPRVGVIPLATPIIAKVLDAHGRGECINLIDAIIWAAQAGAAVISISIGLDFPRLALELQETGMPANAATSAAISAYMQNLQLFETLAAHLSATPTIGRRSIIVAAAGNESNRIGERPYVITASPLAAGPHILTVGAATLAEDGRVEVASYSNSNVDIFGPGTDVLGAVPGGGLATMSGTSMATPFVAGAAALVTKKLADFGPIRPDQTIAFLRSHTSSVRGTSDSDGNAGLVRVP